MHESPKGESKIFYSFVVVFFPTFPVDFIFFLWIFLGTFGIIAILIAK